MVRDTTTCTTLGEHYSNVSPHTTHVSSHVSRSLFYFHKYLEDDDVVCLPGGPWCESEERTATASVTTDQVLSPLGHTLALTDRYPPTLPGDTDTHRTKNFSLSLHEQISDNSLDFNVVVQQLILLWRSLLISLLKFTLNFPYYFIDEIIFEIIRINIKNELHIKV